MNLWKALRWSIASVATAYIGQAMNGFVEAQNGGLMPVFRPICGPYSGAQMDFIHACASGATRYPALADWISITYWIISPGDVLILAGVIGTLVMAVFVVVATIKLVVRKLRK